MIEREGATASGQTSAQYLVQATTRSSRPRSRIVSVALGCRQTTRWGVKCDGMSRSIIRRRVLWHSTNAVLCKARMYSAQLLDHFEHPRNAGDLARADARVRAENPACGDILELSIKVMGGRISDVRFLAKGCVPAMACGSLITEMIGGKTIQEARVISKEDVVKEIGGLPSASGHAAQLAVDALRAVLEKTVRDA